MLDSNLKPIAMNLTYPPFPFNRTGLPVIAEFDDDDSGLPGVLAGIIVPHIVCTIFILARIVSRGLLLRKWYPDDTLIVLAWLCSTAVCVVYSIAAETPSILAAPDPNTLQDSTSMDGRWGSLYPYLMRTYFGLIFYQLCLCLTKLSVLAFYIRMFVSRLKERSLAWATVVVVLCFGIPLLFMSIFQCHPQDGEFFGKPMKCFSFQSLLIASASLHTATDSWLILMIVPCISRLDLPPRQKIALAMVLSLSIFVIAASLVRLQLSLHRQYRPSNVGVTNMMAFFVMTVLECDIALICASAPMLRPLLAKLFPKLMGEDKRRSAIDEDSMDLTSVVSYHGYPWTEPATPLTTMTRSRNRSIGSHLDRMPPSAKLPTPPMPTLTVYHRTPTTLSLKSMINTMTPRSRGRTLSGDKIPILDMEADERRTSGGFEAYHKQYLAYDEQKPGKPDGLHTHPHIFGDRGWGYSQESFVLGLNDPLSPSRLSPVSGLSGETFAGHADAASLGEESIDRRIKKGGPKDSNTRESGSSDPR